MLLIFDWDGTLINSIDKIVNSMQKSIEDTGLEGRTRNQIEDIIGLGMNEASAQLYPKASDDERADLIERYAAHFIHADRVPCSFFDGSLKLIDQARSNGHQTAVATGKSRRGLTRVLASTGLAGLFDSTRCADETASKPDPLMLNELLEELNCQPADAVMIGDTEFDLEMAQRAGLRSIGVAFGVHSRERLQRWDPIFVAESHNEISEWLDSQPAATNT